MEGKKGWKLLEAVQFIGVGLLVGIVLSAVFVLASGSNKAPDKDVTHITEIDPEAGESKEQVVTIESIDKRLEDLADLSTAEMIYTNLYTVTEGKIPFLTQKGFSMVYTANVRAGIDMAGVQVQLDDKKVTVTLPEAEIQMLKVAPESIQFYDEKHALFNWDKKTDVTQAIALAEADTREKADTDGLLKQAAQRAERIVEGLLKDSVGDRVVVVKHG